MNASHAGPPTIWCCGAGAGAPHGHLVTLFFIFFTLALSVTISNVAPRRDTAGAIMDMHDGNVHVGSDGRLLVRSGLRWLPGAARTRRRDGCDWLRRGFKGCGFYNNHTVNLFTSRDLVNWTSHGNVLPEVNRVDRICFRLRFCITLRPSFSCCGTTTYRTTPRRRHLALALDRSRRSILLRVVPFGLDTPTTRTLGTSACGRTTMAPDIASAHAHCQIERLTDDYLASTWSTTNESSAVFPHGNEAPALFKRNGLWYALVSESCCYRKSGGKVHAY